ncbi:unnamed protein product [Rhodiola kirilowii]
MASPNSIVPPTQTTAQFTKLNETNYLTWLRQIKPYLHGQKLWGYVSGSIPEPKATITVDATDTSPATELPNPAHDEWFTIDQQIVSLLTTSLTDNVSQLTIGFDTSKVIWDCLSRHFSQQSTASAASLKLQLLELQKGSKTVDEYIRHAKSIADALSSIGKPVPEEDLVLSTLHGLGSDYLMLRTTLTQGASLPSFSDLRARILAFDAQRTDSVSSSSVVTALLTQGRDQRDSDRRDFDHKDIDRHTHNRRNQRGRSRGRFYGRGGNYTNPRTPYAAPMIPSQSIMTPTVRARTRLQHGIVQQRLRTDGTVPYPIPRALISIVNSMEPTCFTQATKDPQWRTAMTEEINALLKNQTWVLVPASPMQHVVGSKWIYRIKRKSDGSVERYKARLVAKGFHQQYGIDYGETYSPVIRPTTIRTVLCLAVSRNWPLRQLDVKNAFLHGHLQEDVYMTQPPGFIDPSRPSHVASQVDGLHINQLKYAHDLLDKYGLLHSQPVRTPVAPKAQLNSTYGDLLDNPTLFREIVGSLQYLTITRPDIAYAVNFISQFMSQPRTPHLVAAKRILRYIKGTIDHGLSFTPQRQPVTLAAYSDADWAGCSESRRSQTGYLLYFGSNLVSWCSKKQPTVARSSAESEYRALAHACAETTWIALLLSELGANIQYPILLYCDNLSATYMASNPVFHARTKHIELDYHFVREKVAMGSHLVRYSSAEDRSGQFPVDHINDHQTRLVAESSSKQVTFSDHVSNSEMDNLGANAHQDGIEASTNWNMGNTPYLAPVLEEPSSSFSEDYDPLPAIEGLQISGDAFPGHELQACGYQINGTTSCNFEWVRHWEDGSVNYIEGAKQPNYLVTADDVDACLAIEVQPLDDRKRKGELVKVFANDHRKITCDTEMHSNIEKALTTGHASYKVSLSKGFLDIWEPAILTIKKEGYNIKSSMPGGLVVNIKFSAAMIVVIPYGHVAEFSIICTDRDDHHLRVVGDPADVSWYEKY